MSTATAVVDATPALSGIPPPALRTPSCQEGLRLTLTIREAFMTVGTDVKISYRFSFILPRDYAAK